MLRYFIRRVLLIFPTLLGISVIVFAIMHFVPGGPIEQMLLEMQTVESGEGGAEPAAAVTVRNIPDEALEDIMLS